MKRLTASDDADDAEDKRAESVNSARGERSSKYKGSYSITSRTFASNNTSSTEEECVGMEERARRLLFSHKVFDFLRSGIMECGTCFGWRKTPRILYRRVRHANESITDRVIPSHRNYILNAQP